MFDPDQYFHQSEIYVRIVWELDVAHTLGISGRPQIIQSLGGGGGGGGGGWGGGARCTPVDKSVRSWCDGSSDRSFNGGPIELFLVPKQALSTNTTTKINTFIILSVTLNHQQATRNDWPSIIINQGINLGVWPLIDQVTFVHQSAVLYFALLIC